MRIVVAMSGGVDSSVAAALLVEQGHDVVGLSMQLYDQSSGERPYGSCCSLEDLHDARRVAAALGIPYYVLNLERQFDQQVVSNFVDEYMSGRTPLPCARCNSDLKFSTLAERALGFGADGVATGHYAKVERDEISERYLLRRGLDSSKDQSYFLFSLTQDQLARAWFPVGDWTKSVVRDYARSASLPVAEKPDSQEICFIPDRDYKTFVESRTKQLTGGGVIVDEQGHEVGRHGGVHRFTVGQRKGLGLSAPVAGHSGAPLYVLAVRPAEQVVVIGPKVSLERTELVASNVNWIRPCPDGPIQVSVQIRHRHRAAAATVQSIGGGRVDITFVEPQLAITPGQAAVFYDGDIVVGGGWIC